MMFTVVYTPEFTVTKTCTALALKEKNLEIFLDGKVLHKIVCIPVMERCTETLADVGYDE